VAALTPAERNRRWRLRKKGVPIPHGKPGRKPKVDYFRPEGPEEFLGPLLSIDPQRLRDLESSVQSRGLTLAEFVQMKREQLPYGLQPQATDETDEDTPRDPLTSAILDFDFGSAE
jgi:hypothetical protein